ncbi:MAG: hypothetical protein ACXVAU_01285 [Mucilaginibacter sp.]
MSQINIKQIKNLHNDWLRGLEFYEQETGIIQNRLDEIAADNTGKEASEEIEHFQNQLLIHRNAIDELKHLIHVNSMDLENQLIKTGVFVDERSALEHDQLNEKYITEEQLFNQMRHEFNQFAARWM